MKTLKNQQGQSLVEYLILVCLIAVGSMVLVRSVGQNLNVRFAQVVESLGGKVEGSKTASAVSENMYKKKDMKNFASGALGRSTGSNSGGGAESNNENSQED